MSRPGLFPASGDRYGWFCHYTHMWVVRYLNLDGPRMRECEQLALWYYLLSITGDDILLEGGL